MTISHITVLGGDLRQAYAAEYLSLAGYHITCFKTPCFPYNSSIQVTQSLSEALKGTPALLLPSPLTRDGIHLFEKTKDSQLLSLEELIGQLSDDSIIFCNGITPSFQKQLSVKHRLLYNLGNSPEFTAENARLTAEGLLSELIRFTPFSLENASILLLGYGHCGKAVSTLLSSFTHRIYVWECENSKQVQAEQNGLLVLSPSEKNTILPHCHLIINTIPEHVLTKHDLEFLSGNCHIFDIASAPFGFSSDITTTYSLPYFRLPGLPGKFSPKTAGITIGTTIERMIHHGI